MCVCWNEKGGDFCKSGTPQMGLGLKTAFLVRIVCLVLKGRRRIQIKFHSSLVNERKTLKPTFMAGPWCVIFLVIFMPQCTRGTQGIRENTPQISNLIN